MKETNIDSMKYRTHTHLAGVDVETIVAEKGECVLTIKECYYEKGVNVSGNKTDGYFIEFQEPGIKPMVVNSTNRKTIGEVLKTEKSLSNIESRNIGNWSGMRIELTFDPTIKMMGKVVGGIVVVPAKKKFVSDQNALNILIESKTLEELKTQWSKLTKEEQALSTVEAKKNELKNILP